MAKISKDLSVGNLHPRENLTVTGSLGAVNAEVIVACDGASSLMLDVRGTFSATIEVSGTVDGTNYTPIVIRPINQVAVKYITAVTTAGLWTGKCAGFKSIRARATAWSSGLAIVSLAASNAIVDDSLQGFITTDIVTVTAAVGVAATLTLPVAGTGLRHYITYLRIVKFSSTALTAAAAPVLVTTTNIPGTLAFSLPADAAAQGTVFASQEDYNYPIAVLAQNTATTIVAPATPGVIWRMTAAYYVAP